MTPHKWIVGMLGVGLLTAGCATTVPQDQGLLSSQVGGLQTQVAALNSQVEELRSRQQALEDRAWDRRARPAAPAPLAGTGRAISERSLGTRKVLTAREIQQALKTAGFYHGSVDGKIGPQTRVAIKAFQSSNQLVADGVAGTKTMAALERYLGDGPMPEPMAEEFP